MIEKSRSKETFIDRRLRESSDGAPVRERRQFTNSYEELSPDARELALAVDQYKLHHRRRYITFEELHSVVTGLGYSKTD